MTKYLTWSHLNQERLFSSWFEGMQSMVAVAGEHAHIYLEHKAEKGLEADLDYTPQVFS